MSTTEAPALDPKTADALGYIRNCTNDIRGHQQAIEDIADSRRERILELRAARITYREIAAAMGTTEQCVYKILKSHIAEQRA